MAASRGATPLAYIVRIRKIREVAAACRGCRRLWARRASHSIRIGDKSGCPNVVRPYCGHIDACLLCPGEAQPVVHTCVCRIMRNGIGLRIPSGSLAVRAGGIDLVYCSGKALVGREDVQLTSSRLAIT
jgi:hypothetical protein